MREQAHGTTIAELIRPLRVTRPPEAWSDARPSARPAAFAHPTSREMLEETIALIGVVPLYGPPTVLVVGPWLLRGGSQ